MNCYLYVNVYEYLNQARFHAQCVVFEHESIRRGWGCINLSSTCVTDLSTKYVILYC